MVFVYRWHICSYLVIFEVVLVLLVALIMIIESIIIIVSLIVTTLIFNVACPKFPWLVKNFASSSKWNYGTSYLFMTSTTLTFSIPSSNKHLVNKSIWVCIWAMSWWHSSSFYHYAANISYMKHIGSIFISCIPCPIIIWYLVKIP